MNRDNMTAEHKKAASPSPDRKAALTMEKYSTVSIPESGDIVNPAPGNGYVGQAIPGVLDILGLCMDMGIALLSYSMGWALIEAMGMQPLAKSSKGFAVRLNTPKGDKYIFYQDGMDRDMTRRVIFHELGHLLVSMESEAPAEAFEDALVRLERFGEAGIRADSEQANPTTKPVFCALWVWRQYGTGQKASQGPGTAGSRIIYPSFGKPLERALSAGER